MVLAGFIRETGDRPARYSAPSESWAAAVAGPDAPGPHVLASRARDLMERHATAFALDRVGAPAPAEFRGLEAVERLAETARALAAWMEEQL